MIRIASSSSTSPALKLNPDLRRMTLLNLPLVKKAIPDTVIETSRTSRFISVLSNSFILP